jgi:hypothetical protein
LSSPEQQSAAYLFLTGTSVAFGVAALAAPQLLLTLALAVEATPLDVAFTRIAGATMAISAAVEYSLQVCLRYLAASSTSSSTWCDGNSSCVYTPWQLWDTCILTAATNSCCGSGFGSRAMCALLPQTQTTKTFVQLISIAAQQSKFCCRSYRILLCYIQQSNSEL